MSLKILVNGKQVFSTKANVNSTKITGSSGHIAEVSGGVDAINLTVQEADGLNVTLDEVDRQTTQAAITETTVKAENEQESKEVSKKASKTAKKTPKKSNKK